MFIEVITRNPGYMVARDFHFGQDYSTEPVEIIHVHLNKPKKGAHRAPFCAKNFRL